MSSDTFSSQSEVFPASGNLEPFEASKPSIPIRRILIIESDVSVADELAQLMEEIGHKAEIASDAKTALLHLHEFRPHVVLLGTYLADMPGYELTAILRGAPQYSGLLHAVGLLFIADRSKLLKHRLIGAPDIPMSQYVFKPINEMEVRDKVERELARAIEMRYPTPKAPISQPETTS